MSAHPPKLHLCLLKLTSVYSAVLKSIFAMNSYLRKKIQEAETQSEESEDYQDSDFHVSDVSDVDEPCEETVHTTNDVQEPDKAAFIVYWTSLLVLLQRCLHLACVLPAAITNIAFKWSQLIVKLKCQSGHTNTWKSQPTCKHYSDQRCSSPL